jgi:hypothetical protein
VALGDVLGLLAGSFGAGLSEYGAQQARTAELKRKQEEVDRINRATSALFGGGELTPERAGAAITAGVSPTVVSSAQMFGRRQEPESEPTITVQPYMGGQARMKNGVFDSWVIRPQAERDTGPTPADIRAAQTDLRGTEQAFTSVMRQKPRLAQFPGAENIGTDTAAFNRAMQNWAADSTYAAQRRQAAGEEVSRLTGRNPLTVAPARQTMVPNAAEQSRIRMQAQSAIQQIMASPLSDAEKASRVQMVNTRLRTALSNLNP